MINSMWLKQVAKRSAVLSSLHRRLQWKLHLFKDWWGSRVWTRTTDAVTPLGFKLTSGFHPAYRLMREGMFEPDEVALICMVLPRVDVFVDVGANLGYYSCLALQRGKPVLAFEPQEQNLRCLLRNLIANGWESRAEVFPLALGSGPGLLTLYGASGPSASLIRNWAGYSPKYSKTVPVSTLDRIVGSRYVGQRLLIKIDVEGAEYQVLQGATATLSLDPKPVWLVEICLEEFHPDGANPDFRAIFQLFWQHGYQAFAATRDARPLTPQDIDVWLQSGHANSGTYNYVFAESATLLHGQ